MTDTRKIPTHEITYARLRDMILFGLLEPGAPVTIQGLINDLGAGMTPVREALRRLAAEVPAFAADWQTSVSSSGSSPCGTWV